MLLPPPSAPHSTAQRFISDPAVGAGLRSLLLAPDAAACRGRVVTRAAAAAVATRGDAAAARSCPSGGGGGEDVVVVEASGGGTSTGSCEGTKNAEDDDDAEDVNGRDAAEEKEAGIISAEEDEDLDGFWVSYGRRRPRRRLPPPIPSLVARGALRRTRTRDGRLVIRIVPVVRPECVRALRGRGGGDRLAMRLVEHEDDSPMMAPPLREPSGAGQDGSVISIARQGGGDTATPRAGGDRGVDDVEEAMAAPEPDAVMPVVPPPRVPSAGCFEDVFRFDRIGTGSLHRMPSLRMVH